MIRSDLEREFETIGTTLQDTSKIQIERDWQQRLNALRRVQALLQEGIVDHPNFNRIFLNFISPLSIQLQDLRSAIVKEAVATTQMAAEIAQTSFEACAEKLSETLFKLLNSGTKILAEYGNECFLSILENVPTWRLIPKIIEQFSSKNTNIRIKSAQYLQFILENYPIQVIQEGISQRSKLTEMIERGIKRIVSDAANDARAAGRRCFQGYQAMFPDRGGALFHQLDTSVQRALSGELGGVPAMPSPSKQSLKVPPANNKRSTSARMSRQNVPAQPVEQPKPQKQNSQKLNKSVPKNLYNERDATPTEVVRDPSGTGGSDILERPRMPPSREIEQKQQAAFQRPAPVPEPPKRQLSQEKPSVQGQLDITLEKFYNDNWAIRFNASERITTFLNSDEVIELLSTNNSLWDSMMQAHLEHMNDQHFKVSVSCLSNLKTITELFPEKVSFALENIMPRLLVCLADSKEILSSSATGLLETILDIYMPEDLIVLLLRWNPTENKPKIKVKLLELFGQLVNQIPDYFDTVGNVKLYLRKVAQLLKDTQTSRPVIAAASNSIQVARAKNLTCMMSALAELSEEEQSILKTLAQDSGIPLEAQRQNIRKSNSQPTQPKSAGMQLVEGLLRQLRGSGAVRYDALKKIQALNESYEANYVIWEESFQQILTSLLECLNDESLAIRDLVLQILKSIFETQQANGQQNIEQTLNALTQALYWEERQMMQSTEETMMQILERLDPGRAISLILKIVPEVRVPAIQALIRHMTKVVQRSSPTALNPLLRDLVDQLKVQFNHSNADVRKSVVFCFVEVFLVMGNEFNAYLEELSPSQQKLVAIYIQRRHDSTNFQYQDLQVNGIGDTYRSIPQE